MGYYTAYQLNIYPKPVSDNLRAKLKERLDSFRGPMDGDFDYGFSSYDKWYDHEEDLTQLSREFPDYVFELYGDGEGAEDFWVEYFCNGESQFCGGEIVYAECALSRKVQLITRRELQKERGDPNEDRPVP